MIEIILTGTYLGKPHEIGAWAYAIRRCEDLLGAGKGIDRPETITSRLSAEAAALALGLEDLSREWEGEDVVVRTTSAGLEGLLVRQGRGVARNLSLWYSRVRQAAASCASVRILPATPGEVASLRADAEELLPRAPMQHGIARASEIEFLKRGV